MGSRRNGERQPTSEKCVLHHAGKTLECWIEEISISGLRVRINETAALSAINPGDLCTINFADNPGVSHREVRCSVARRTPTYIALELSD